MQFQNARFCFYFCKLELHNEAKNLRPHLDKKEICLNFFALLSSHHNLVLAQLCISITLKNTVPVMKQMQSEIQNPLNSILSRLC